MTTKRITVILTKRKVAIVPPHCCMDQGCNEIKWELIDDSKKYNFADPPVTFDDSEAPMSHFSPHGGEATCTDDNRNETGSDQVYRYHVHLIGPHGGSITFPPRRGKVRSGDPYIHNKPK